MYTSHATHHSLVPIGNMTNQCQWQRNDDGDDYYYVFYILRSHPYERPNSSRTDIRSDNEKKKKKVNSKRQTTIKIDRIPNSSFNAAQYIRFYRVQSSVDVVINRKTLNVQDDYTPKKKIILEQSNSFRLISRTRKKMIILFPNGIVIDDQNTLIVLRFSFHVLLLSVSIQSISNERKK